MTDKIVSMKSLTHDDIRTMDIHDEDRLWMELTKQFGGSVIHLEELEAVK